MELLVAGLSGVVVGAIVASVIILHLFQRRADRDLVERRLRACFDYRECLGDLESVFEGANGDPRVLEQAWHNAASFCRELRRTGWLFRTEVRLRLLAVAEDLERERRAHESNGADTGGRAAQLLCEKCREVERILIRETEEQAREHRRLRFLPDKSAEEGGK